MTREEIKFRVWDRTERKMHEATALVKVNDRWRARIGDNGKYDTLNPGYDPIMQYTGLRDINGREIYEEDIVEIQDTTVDGDVWTFRGKIEFWKGGFCAANSTAMFPMHLWEQEDYQVTVIGNIYENPELGTSMKILI